MGNKDLDIIMLYDVAKQFYPFYYNEHTSAYFVTEEARRLYNVVANKDNNELYLTRFSSFAAHLKETFPESDLFEIRNNRPSLTLRMNYYFNIGHHSAIKVFLSFSLLDNYYVFFIESYWPLGQKVVIGSPKFELADFFLKIDHMIEASFPDFRFVPTHFARANFFDLTVPGYTKSSKYDGSLLNKANILNALFFEYENFSAISDRSYKFDPVPDSVVQDENDEIMKILKVLCDESKSEIAL